MYAVAVLSAILALSGVGGSLAIVASVHGSDDLTYLTWNWRANKPFRLTDISNSLLDTSTAKRKSDFRNRKMPGFRGWLGADPGFKALYEVKKSPGAGLGVFVRQKVHKGQVVYINQPKDFVWVPQSRAGILAQVATAFSSNVTSMASHWCLADWFCGQGGMICEFSDGRYINDDIHPNLGPCKNEEYGICALRTIHAGEELRENYAAENLGDSDSMDLLDVLENDINPKARPESVIRSGAYCTKNAEQNRALQVTADGVTEDVTR